jgi:hypothetical protein
MGTYRQDLTVFVGNSAYPILATAGGLVGHLVKLNDKVEVGQKVAIQRAIASARWLRVCNGVAGEIGQRNVQCQPPPRIHPFSTATPDGGEIYRVIQRLCPRLTAAGLKGSLAYKILRAGPLHPLMNFTVEIGHRPSHLLTCAG